MLHLGVFVLPAHAVSLKFVHLGLVQQESYCAFKHLALDGPTPPLIEFREEIPLNIFDS